jgi:nucleotide-binding universal stress UspA family protein
VRGRASLKDIPDARHGAPFAMLCGVKRIRRIVYATDFSAASRPAFAAAINLARTLDARLTIVHVTLGLIPILPDQYLDVSLYDRIERGAHEWSVRRLTTLAARARKQGVRVNFESREGDPATQVVKVAKARRADLLITGTHGRGGVPRFFLGSVADRLVRTSPCPVMTVRSK